MLLSPETTKSPLARGKQAFELNGGSGTHVDAPAHFIPGGRTIEALAVEELVNVPLAVIDATAACADPDHQVTQAEIEADEHLHGPILPKSLVCVRTGWARNYEAARSQLRERRLGRSTDFGDRDLASVERWELSWTSYHGAPPMKEELHPKYKLPRMHFPGVSPEAAAWLVAERHMLGLGIDTLSPDAGASEDFGVHHAVLGADRYIIESLNLEGLPARGALATVSPLALAGAPEAPARVFAIWQE